MGPVCLFGFSALLRTSQSFRVLAEYRLQRQMWQWLHMSPSLQPLFLSTYLHAGPHVKGWPMEPGFSCTRSKPGGKPITSTRGGGCKVGPGRDGSSVERSRTNLAVRSSSASDWGVLRLRTASFVAFLLFPSPSFAVFDQKHSWH